MEEDSSEKMPSNEEIIDELTKNLEDSCIKMDDDIKSTNGTIDSAELEDDDNELINCKNESMANIDPFYVDEEEIKSRDLNLSDSEKEDCKNKAEKLKLEANSFFKEGKYEEATNLYTSALKILPLDYKNERAILYANCAAAKAKFMVEKEVAIIDCTKAIELDPNYVKAYLRRAHLYEETEKLNEALEDYKKILSLHPSHTEANCAVRKLPPKIEEQNEKLKADMLIKLKDLGNMILRPFGLSTNNFELQKDPNSGSYSVKFNQNPT